MSSAFVVLHAFLISVQCESLDLETVLCKESMDVVLGALEVDVGQEDVPVIVSLEGVVDEVLVLSKDTWLGERLVILLLLVVPVIATVSRFLRLHGLIAITEVEVTVGAFAS